MAQTPVNRGSSPGDGTGDSAFTAFGKLNHDIGELYALVAALGTSSVASSGLNVLAISMSPPAPADIALGTARLVLDTSTGRFSIWANTNGTLAEVKTGAVSSGSLGVRKSQFLTALRTFLPGGLKAFMASGFISPDPDEDSNIAYFQESFVLPTGALAGIVKSYLLGLGWTVDQATQTMLQIFTAAGLPSSSDVTPDSTSFATRIDAYLAARPGRDAVTVGATFTAGEFVAVRKAELSP